MAQSTKKETMTILEYLHRRLDSENHQNYHQRSTCIILEMVRKRGKKTQKVPLDSVKGFGDVNLIVIFFASPSSIQLIAF